MYLRAAIVNPGNSAIMIQPAGIAVAVIMEAKALWNCVAISLILSVRIARKE